MMRSLFFYCISFLLLVLLLIGFSWWQLKQGISLNRIALPSIELNHLSIKLDKQLVIDLGRIEIRPGPGQPLSNDALEKLVTWIKRATPLVQKIQIHRADYSRFSGSISYTDNTIRVDGNDLKIAAVTGYENGTFYIDFSDLSLKRYQLHLTGRATYARLTDLLNFSGAIKGFGINGTLELTYQEDTVDALLKTRPFTDLATVCNQIPMDEEIRSWTTQKITAHQYQVDRLHLRFKIKDGVPVIEPDSIEGSARADEADIRFHPDLPPVHCKEIGIAWHNDRLTFDLAEPVYEGKKLDGSRVTIDHIIGDDSALAINIKTETRLDAPVNELLKAYEVHLPFLQQSGSTRADLHLQMDLSDFDLQTRGEFVTGEGKWSCLGVPFLAHGAAVHLENNQVTLERVDLSYDDILWTRLAGTINTTTGIAELNSDIDRLTLNKGGDAILLADHLSTPVTVDFSGAKIKIDLKQFQTTITLDGTRTRVMLAGLTALKPIVPLLQQFDYREGRAEMTTRDMKNFHFAGAIDIPNTLLSQEDTPITSFVFQANVTPEKTELSLNKGAITATITDTIQINLTDCLLTLNDTGKPFNPGKPLHVSGVNSPLNINGYDLPAKQYRLKSDGGKTICTVHLEKGNIQFDQAKDGTFTLEGVNLPTDLAAQYITFVKLQHGEFNIFIRGTRDNYEGYIDIKDVVVQDSSYVILNNIFAFIDAIPALATFSSPGFNQDGYKVKEGLIHFRYHDDVLTFLNGRIDGTSINSLFKGRVDFHTKTVDMDLSLQTLKSFSSIINMIPWASYAILGENGTLSTTLKIEGGLDNPQVTTHLSAEAVMAPINIIKRTIEWPFRLLKKATE